MKALKRIIFRLLCCIFRFVVRGNCRRNDKAPRKSIVLRNRHCHTFHDPLAQLLLQGLNHAYGTFNRGRALAYYLLAMTVSIGAEAAAEIMTSQQDRQEISLTVYNKDLALIRDVRRVSLIKGLNRIAIREVSANIRPETAILTNISHPNSLSLLEQNFDYDLLTPKQLLRKYVGREIKVVKTHPTTGAEKEVVATVLSANNGVVLRIGDRIETGVPGRIVYDQVPGNLRDRPTLSILVDSSIGNEQTLALSYLSGGLGWRADYVAVLDHDDTRLDLSGWVTLSNKSGTSYTGAKLQLVAGDVHRVHEAFPRHVEVMQSSPMADDRSGMREEGLFEYHLYTLGHRTDVLDNQTKQVSLMSADQVPVKKEFLLYGQERYYHERYGVIGDKIPVDVYMEFANTKENGLGIALPGGVARVYKHDSVGNAQFIGEDRITHTPKGETIRIKMGSVFDVTAKRTQTEYAREEKIRFVSGYRWELLLGFDIEIYNAKDEDVSVRVLEPMPGDWKILASSILYTKPDARTAEWEVKVPAGQRVNLKYKVQIRY